MNQVIGTIAEKIGDELRVGASGKLNLYIQIKCQNWDTNTGRDDGPAYIQWVKATKEQSRDFARNYNRRER